MIKTPNIYTPNYGRGDTFKVIKEVTLYNAYDRSKLQKRCTLTVVKKLSFLVYMIWFLKLNSSDCVRYFIT